MAFSKTEEFSKEAVYLADVAKALSHPARVQIVQTLSAKACICGDLVEILPLAQATVSQHLKELKRAGIIKGEIEGPRTCYCLDEEAVRKIKKAFEKFFNKLSDIKQED
ncbi:MAG TPA: metalloregulator ArsR/SmtB family transcription factor [Ignavibacteriales bacterium]|nr:metalloregulator ArsR/SmtB family transcription factor [Ignavibacteriales bacterium]